MKIKKTFSFQLASIAFVLCLTTSLQAADSNPKGFQTLKIGDQAPDFTLPGIDGRDYSLADFKNAEILMVFFTSNHCPTSHAAEGRLQKMLNDLKAQNRSFGFVAINPNNPEGMSPAELGFGRYTDSFEDMVSYAKKNGWTFPYLYDGDKQIIAREPDQKTIIVSHEAEEDVANVAHMNKEG